MPVLAARAGRTKTGRLWAYVSDERGAGSDAPPAVLFRYTPDRKDERPAQRVTRFIGNLQADGCARFDLLYGDRVDEVACWARVRRKLFNVYDTTRSATASEALDYIAMLFAVEDDSRSRAPDDRQCERQARSGLALAAFRHVT